MTSVGVWGAIDSLAAFTIFIFLVLPMMKSKAVVNSAGDICMSRISWNRYGSIMRYG